jgi:hypothetical protein
MRLTKGSYFAFINGRGFFKELECDVNPMTISWGRVIDRVVAYGMAEDRKGIENGEISY